MGPSPSTFIFNSLVSADTRPLVIEPINYERDLLLLIRPSEKGGCHLLKLPDSLAGCILLAAIRFRQVRRLRLWRKFSTIWYIYQCYERIQKQVFFFFLHCLDYVKKEKKCLCVRCIKTKSLLWVYSYLLSLYSLTILMIWHWFVFYC